MALSYPVTVFMSVGECTDLYFSQNALTWPFYIKRHFSDLSSFRYFLHVIKHREHMWWYFSNILYWIPSLPLSPPSLSFLPSFFASFLLFLWTVLFRIERNTIGQANWKILSSYQKEGQREKCHVFKLGMEVRETTTRPRSQKSMFKSAEPWIWFQAASDFRNLRPWKRTTPRTPC